MAKFGFGAGQIKTHVDVFPCSPQVDNVSVTKCEFITEQNWDAIEVTYECGSAILTDRMFLPTYENSKPFPGGKRSQDEEYDYRVNMFSTHCFLIAEAIGLSIEDLRASVDETSTTTFCNSYCHLINTHIKSGSAKKVWLKTTRNTNNYIKVARTSSSARPFIQMIEEGVPCRLSYTSSEKNKLEAVVNSVPASTMDTSEYVDTTEWGSAEL